MTPGMPPPSPDVQQQQLPAPMRFMQQAGGAQAEQAQQFSTSAFLKDRLNQVAGLLKDVANVLVVDKPALMPILQKMIQAGAAIMSEMQQGEPEQPAPQDDPSAMAPQFPQPNSAAGAVAMG